MGLQSLARGFNQGLEGINFNIEFTNHMYRCRQRYHLSRKSSLSIILLATVRELGTASFHFVQWLG
jgi:hypothetical protein